MDHEYSRNTEHWDGIGPNRGELYERDELYQFE
jgi:hypothetical protein